LNGELMRATVLLHNWRVSTCATEMRLSHSSGNFRR
jgi:hypothetical protein